MDTSVLPDTGVSPSHADMSHSPELVDCDRNSTCASAGGGAWTAPSGDGRWIGVWYPRDGPRVCAGLPPRRRRMAAMACPRRYCAMARPPGEQGPAARKLLEPNAPRGVRRGDWIDASLIGLAAVAAQLAGEAEPALPAPVPHADTAPAFARGVRHASTHAVGVADPHEPHTLPCSHIVSAIHLNCLRGGAVGGETGRDATAATAVSRRARWEPGWSTSTWTEI